MSPVPNALALQRAMRVRAAKLEEIEDREEQ
jgi:hypothetical protein